MTIGQYRNVNDVSFEIKDKKKESKLVKGLKNFLYVGIPVTVLIGLAGYQPRQTENKPLVYVGKFVTSEGVEYLGFDDPKKDRVLDPLGPAEYLFNDFPRRTKLTSGKKYDVAIAQPKLGCVYDDRIVSVDSTK